MFVLSRRQLRTVAYLYVFSPLRTPETDRLLHARTPITALTDFPCTSRVPTLVSVQNDLLSSLSSRRSADKLSNVPLIRVRNALFVDKLTDHGVHHKGENRGTKLKSSILILPIIHTRARSQNVP